MRFCWNELNVVYPSRQTSWEAWRLSWEFDPRLSANPRWCFCHFLLFCWNWLVSDIRHPKLKLTAVTFTVFYSTDNSSMSMSQKGEYKFLDGNLFFPVFRRFPIKKIAIKKDLELLSIEMTGWSGSNIQDLFSLFPRHF